MTIISKLTSVSDAVKSVQGTSYFSDVNDALENIGSDLRSPSFDSVDTMKVNATALDVSSQFDQIALNNALGQTDGMAVWDTITQVQDLSDGLTTCGDYARDALLGAQQDFIRNSGIQQAGRELSAALGKADSMVDCVAGFATLFESKGVIDDALGLGDMAQIKSRVGQLVIEGSNPYGVSNMITNAQAIQDLVLKYNNMCGDMMNSLNDLIQKDVTAMASALAALSRWAAFAKLATSDPCALVNNNMLLGHITEPVMDDIVKLYQGVTGQTPTPTDPIVTLGNLLGKPVGTVVDVPKLKQAATEGLQTFGSFAKSIPTGTDTITESYESTSMDYINGVGWVVPEGSKTDFTKGVLSGKTMFNNSAGAFKDNAKKVEYDAVSKNPKSVAKVHKVGWCTGGLDPETNRDEAECKAKEGDWAEREMTDNEIKVAGSVEAVMGTVAKTLSDAFGSIIGDPPPSSGSSALSGASVPVVVSKVRDSLGLSGPWKGAKAGAPSAAPKPQKQKSSPDPTDPMPFLPLESASFALAKVMPGVGAVVDGALAAIDYSIQKSNIGGDISEVHQSREVVERAMKTGDWSSVETCSCKPKAAQAGSVEVGSCDFTGLGFPEGYKLIEKSFYTPALLSKVEASEAQNTGEYVMGDDGSIYQSAEVVVMAKYGATKIDPFQPGKETCIKYSGKWVTTVGSESGSSGSGESFDIKMASSKAVCENANGTWVCKKGTLDATSKTKAVESFGKFTNKKNVNTKSKLPSEKQFDTDKLPSITFSKFV
ncbi:MAG: hypothetical protein OR994_04910 [Candidatus Poseidoniales archaeon]|nr:hypothetical protein [Candidatus Poseidoniales archaeon]